MDRELESASPVAPVETSVLAPSPLRAHYALYLLTATYALNYVDRNVFSILLESIKHDLHASDTVMGLLAGFTFVIFQGALGLPIARLADRNDRRSILALGILLWSAMTALSGVARGVVQLAFARIGVGVGEAASATAPALISDLFPQEQRQRAMGVYSTGLYLGVFLGYFVGGWVNQLYGWRAAFFAAGAPGLLLALVLRFTVADPRRGGTEKRGVDIRQEPLAQTFRFMARQTSFVWGLIGFCLTSFTNFGLSVWVPAFMRRVHHMSNGEIGTYTGTARGLVAMAGALTGGFVVQRLSRSDPRWMLRAPAIASILGGPALLIFLFSDSNAGSLAGLGLAAYLIGFHIGPIWTLGQTVVKVGMRSLSYATVSLIGSAFGLGLGPLLIGMANDHLRAQYGDVAIRYSMISIALASTLGGGAFWYAARFIDQDLARVAGTAVMPD
jgi:MFS family permease